MNPPLHIVLVEPEIPPNTGNIARLCACTSLRLHLVHPLGFSTDDRHLKRAGLDYWQHLDLREHASWQAAERALPDDAHWFALTTKARRNIWETRFEQGDVLIFGPESRGLPQHLIEHPRTKPVRIPMRSDAPVRSLNLSSACAIAAFEALRQIAQTDGRLR
ncbi:MAG: tRNA (cytidine(34)-2'-O)-methyltransferase [Mariprofundaceae bacterium]